MASAAERLLDAVLGAPGAPPARVSVVGICKNAGKTTALNRLIAAADGRGLGLALVSTGRDGEEQDAITELPKPRIYAPAGAWVATARDALAKGTARIDVIRELGGAATPLGPVVLGRVTVPGEVLLVGPGSAQRVRAGLGALSSLADAARQPVRLALVDGSFDRMAAAAPGVTGQIVLAVGAAYSHSLKSTVAQAAHLLSLFTLPPVEPERRLAAEQAMLAARVSWITPYGGVEPLPALSALVGAEQVVRAAADRLAQPEAEAGAPRPLITVAGAVTDRLVQSLILEPEVTRRVALVVRDATRLLVDRQLWRRFRQQGGRAHVLDPIRVAAVTSNPWTPYSAGHDPEEMIRAVASVAPGLPVIDVETGLMEVITDADTDPGAE